MALIGRLILRLIVVSLGAFVAIYVGTAVACVANWSRFLALLGLSSDNPTIVNIIIGVIMAFVLSYASLIMLTPATIGIAIAETFTVRSWIFHVLNGGVSIWVGWVTLVRGGEFDDFYDNPLAIVATGLSAGFVYWLIAGWNAGVMKPVAAMAPAAPPAPQPPKV